MRDDREQRHLCRYIGPGHRSSQPQGKHWPRSDSTRIDPTSFARVDRFMERISSVGTRPVNERIGQVAVIVSSCWLRGRTVAVASNPSRWRPAANVTLILIVRQGRYPGNQVKRNVSKLKTCSCVYRVTRQVSYRHSWNAFFRPTNSSSCHPERGQMIKGRPPIALSLPKSWTEDPRRDTEEATRRFTRALSPTGRLFYRWQLSIDRLPERHGIWSGNLHVKRKP